MGSVILAFSLLLIILPSITRGQFCNGPKRGYINDTTANGQNGAEDVISVGFFFPFHGPGESDGVCSPEIPNLDNIQLLEMARYTLIFAGIPGVRIGRTTFNYVIMYR